MKKKHREISKLARQYNRTLERRKGGHLALICNSGTRATVFTAASSSDHRFLKNLQKHLKHAEVGL